jgi:hypothetical protein
MLPCGHSPRLATGHLADATDEWSRLPDHPETTTDGPARSPDGLENATGCLSRLPGGLSRLPSELENAPTDPERLPSDPEGSGAARWDSVAARREGMAARRRPGAEVRSRTSCALARGHSAPAGRRNLGWRVGAPVDPAFLCPSGAGENIIDAFHGLRSLEDSLSPPVAIALDPSGVGNAEHTRAIGARVGAGGVRTFTGEVPEPPPAACTSGISDAGGSFGGEVRHDR